MKRTRFGISNADIKAQSTHFGVIHKYNEGALTYKDLPRDIIIFDLKTKNEYDCQLIDILPFKNHIPDILCYLSEGKSSAEATPEILNRTEREFINQLAFYCYARI